MKFGIPALLTLQLMACTAQVKEPAQEPQPTMEAPQGPRLTLFPQIHSNLHGRVREFVRTMHQDAQGNLWFGTNGDGIVRYNNQGLESMEIPGIHPRFRVLEIMEDPSGILWFATSEGLLRYDGTRFTVFSTQKDSTLPSDEIWGLARDRSGRMWVGATSGLLLFDKEHFSPLSLPKSRVENAQPMLSDALAFDMAEDPNGTLWFAVDGQGLYAYRNGQFDQLTTADGLPDNNVADLLVDRKGNLWIGTFNGGMSRYDGSRFTNYTLEGAIEGPETYNLLEDHAGNIWFSAEGFGVYRFDGENFTHFTTNEGLTTNTVQCIFEDRKNRLWFATWQGLCIFNGERFVDAETLEPW